MTVFLYQHHAFREAERLSDVLRLTDQQRRSEAKRDARAQGRVQNALTRSSLLLNGFLPLKAGGHQREIDGRSKGRQANPLHWKLGWSDIRRFSAEDVHFV